MAKNAINAYRQAIAQKPEIVTTRDNLKDHKGNSMDELEALGLTKQHLLRLQRMGLALKALTPNVFAPKSDEPNCWVQVPVEYKDKYQKPNGYVRAEKRVEMELRPRYWYRGKGSRVRWILFAE
jgi:hypothetical protein